LKAEADIQKREIDKKRGQGVAIRKTAGLGRGSSKRKDTNTSEVAENEDKNVDGNRTLISLNVLLNNIGERGILALQNLLSVNNIITRCCVAI